MKVEWNKVTWYSKIIALVLFVALPFAGFYYGTKYGEALQLVASVASSTAAAASVSGVPMAAPDYGTEYYQNVAEWQTDVNNASGGFSIAYPIDFDAQDNYPATPSADWRLGADGTQGIKYFTLVVPRAFEPQTNFADATLTVGASAGSSAVAQCLAPDMEGEAAAATSSATINGANFVVFRSTDAGAGNYYETTSYRTLHAGKCYAVEYTIHSSQIANYPQSYDLHPFDDATITGLMSRIVGTFKFN